MKTCTKCGLEKLLTEYFVKDSHTGRLHAQCKACYKEHRKGYYKAHYEKYKKRYLARASVRRKRLRQEFRAHMLEFLSAQACVDCGESDIRVLELDHIDPATKLFNVSQAVVLGFNWEHVLKEIKKCEVRCANCHKRRTAIQFKWYKA